MKELLERIEELKKRGSISSYSELEGFTKLAEALRKDMGDTGEIDEYDTLKKIWNLLGIK